MKYGRAQVRALRAQVIRPGDVVVVQAPDSLTAEQAEGVDAIFKAQGVRCIVVGGGLRVIAVKPADQVACDPEPAA